MKKKLWFIILLLLLAIATYFFLWGGKPRIDDFEEVSNDYEVVAKLALSTYKEVSPEEEYITIFIHDGNFSIYVDVFENNDLTSILTQEQQDAVIVASKKFDHLRICEDAVFFCKDETGYYGLVYSKHPIIALYKNELPQKGRDYHRINSRWYEWGVFGK